MPPSATPPGGVLPSETQSHIGVPNDYTPPAPYSPPYVLGPPPPTVGTVRYSPGDELTPLNTPELIPQLQAQLASIGYLDPKNIRLGQWDSASQSAYKKVLAFANQTGVTAQEALQVLAANPTLGQLQGDSGSTRAPNVVQETNPIDIAATAQDTALKLLGRRLSDSELEPFIKQYQAQESGAQTKAYKLGGAKGGVVVTPPSVGSAAEDYYRKNFGQEQMGYAAVERMNDFYSLLGTPVTGNG